MATRRSRSLRLGWIWRITFVSTAVLICSFDMFSTQIAPQREVREGERWRGKGTGLLGRPGRPNKPNIARQVFPPVMNPEWYPEIMGRVPPPKEEEFVDEKTLELVRRALQEKSSDEDIPESGAKNLYEKAAEGDTGAKKRGGFIPDETRLALRTRRIHMQLTHAELAAKLGVDTSLVVGWEEGTAIPDHITFSLLQKTLATRLPAPEFPVEIKHMSWDETSDEAEEAKRQEKKKADAEAKKAAAEITKEMDQEDADETVTAAVTGLEKALESAEAYEAKPKRRSKAKISNEELRQKFMDQLITEEKMADEMADYVKKRKELGDDGRAQDGSVIMPYESLKTVETPLRQLRKESANIAIKKTNIRESFDDDQIDMDEE